MNLEKYQSSPWQESHEVFAASPFNIRPKPEFSTGEVVLSSLYRASGFKGVSEKSVPSLGREFLDRLTQRVVDQDEALPISTGALRDIVDRFIESPKAAKQSTQRFLSLSPIVPDTSIYSGAARLRGNPWNPGQLIKRMIAMGATAPGEAAQCWSDLHEALSISNQDDVWARWLQETLAPLRPVGLKWELQDLDALESFPESDKVAINYPARQFVSDLRGMFSAKDEMTRRQWVTLLESLLRIATTSHVLWLCDVCDRIWREILGTLEASDGGEDVTADSVRHSLLSVRPRMLSYGNPAIPTITSFASRYLSARIGFNVVLIGLEKAGVPQPRLQSAEDVAGLINRVRERRSQLTDQKLVEVFRGIQDKQVRTIACKKGVGSNLLEFCQYTLGQRQTMDEALRGYDQGYFLRKNGDARNAPWVLSMGPAALLAMVHCCLHEVDGPRSIHRLAAHLAHYGIEFDLHGVNDSELGRQLRMLGLVLDSPDAESGMLLVPPFSNGKVLSDE